MRPEKTVRVSVTDEVYRVYLKGSRYINAHRAQDGSYVPLEIAPHEDFHNMGEAIVRAYQLGVERAIATGGQISVIVDRVTKHEPVPSDSLFFAGATETITGKYEHESPHWAACPDLSRYDPVNGWVVPTEIEI